MKKIIYAIAISTCIMAVSCNSNPLKIDVSDIDVNIKVERFDSEFYACADSCSFYSIKSLDEKYPTFFETYNQHIISCGSYSDLSYYECLKTFFSDYAVIQAYTYVNKEFNDCSDIEKTIIEGFKHLKHYFPDEELPRIVTFVAGFNQSIALMEDYICVGLDKYLGQDCPLYDDLQIPTFAKTEMRRERIPIDIMSEWYRDNFPYEPESDNLINNMIYNGMVLYFLEAMYPEMEETTRLNFSEKQLEFCKYFESNIWTSLIENNLLFTTDLIEIQKFTGSGPYTKQFGPESPARAACWTGLQIVKSYVKNNKVSLQELAVEKDYQKILSMSEYEPKRF